MWGPSLSCTQLAVLWVWQCRLSFVECRLLPATTINGIPTCLAACRLTGNFKNFNSQKFTGMRPFTCTRYVLVCPFVGNPVGSLSLPLSPPSLSLYPSVHLSVQCRCACPAFRPIDRLSARQLFVTASHSKGLHFSIQNAALTLALPTSPSPTCPYF